MATPENKYIVELVDSFASDLGQMSETHLCAYLSNRPLMRYTPEQVLARLADKDEVMVHFQPTLGSGNVTNVKIRRIRSVP